jgi:hypothetical protein
MISLFENLEVDEFLKRHQEKMKNRDFQNLVRLIALARIIACQLTLQKISEKKQNANGSSSNCKLCENQCENVSGKKKRFLKIFKYSQKTETSIIANAARVIIRQLSSSVLQIQKMSIALAVC